VTLDGRRVSSSTDVLDLGNPVVMRAGKRRHMRLTRAEGK
jgi:hypothetical protein